MCDAIRNPQPFGIFFPTSFSRVTFVKGAILALTVAALFNVSLRSHSGNGFSSVGTSKRYVTLNGHRRAASLILTTQEPSHIQLCRGVLSRIGTVPNQVEGFDGSMEDQDEVEWEAQIIQEKEGACTDQTSPHSTLLQIFSTQYLGSISEMLNVGLGYDHRCHRFDTGKKMLQSVQMTLPSPLLLPDDVMEGGLLTREELTQVCERCIGGYEDGTILGGAMECFLGKTEGGMATLLPVIQENLRAMASSSPQAVTAASAAAMPTVVVEQETTKEEEDRNDNNRRRLTGQETEYPPLPFQKLSQWNRWSRRNQRRNLLANPNTDAPSHDGFETAVIYLGHVEEPIGGRRTDESSAYGIPFFEYAIHIPTSITNIRILTTRYCDEATPACRAYGKSLRDYLSRLYPRASVQIQVVNTAAAYRAMIGEPLLVCPPGMACTLPALSRTSSQTTVLAQSGVAYPWLRRLPARFTNAVAILPEDRSSLLETDPDDPTALTPTTVEFITSPPHDTAQCPTLRGRLGSWVQDPDLVPSLQYPSPLDHYFGFADKRFVPLEGRPYRVPTTYSWVEDPTFETCPITILNRESFCQILNDMQVKRVFILGDFVQMNMAYSLWKILGHEDSPKDMKDSEPNWSRIVACPGGNDGDNNIVLEFLRNEKMDENDLEVSVPENIPNCAHAYCYPWTAHYASFTERTLLIASFGSHFYDESDFSQAFDRFLTMIDQVTRPDDVVFYRTTSPGHDKCRKGNHVHPFGTFKEYEPTITWKYSWDLFDGYNDIATRKVRQYNAQTRGARVDILDVYPMTVLRPDGHVGGRDCRNCMVTNDCFYYSLPGPSDWWTHLLFSNLKDGHHGAGGNVIEQIIEGGVMPNAAGDLPAASEQTIFE